MIQVGQTLKVGPNGGDYLGDFLVDEEVVVVGVGADWIVVRDKNGQPWAAAFLIPPDHNCMRRVLES